MASKPSKSTAVDVPEYVPTTHVSWEKKNGPKVKGDIRDLAVGRRAEFLLEGTVRSVEMRDTGCSVSLEVKRIRMKNHTDKFEDENGDKAF